jgi:hypothetical protein
VDRRFYVEGLPAAERTIFIPINFAFLHWLGSGKNSNSVERFRTMNTLVSSSSPSSDESDDKYRVVVEGIPSIHGQH